MIELLNKAQIYDLLDQRGPIDSRCLKIPEFLLSPSSSKIDQIISKQAISLNQMNHLDDLSNSNFHSTLNESALSLPTATSNFYNYSPNSSTHLKLNDNYHHNIYISKHGNFNSTSKSMHSTRSIAIAYDNDGYNKNDSINEFDLKNSTDSTAINTSNNYEPYERRNTLIHHHHHMSNDNENSLKSTYV